MTSYLLDIGAILVWCMVFFTFYNTLRAKRRIQKLYKEAEDNLNQAARMLQLAQWMAAAVRDRNEERSN